MDTAEIIKIKAGLEETVARFFPKPSYDDAFKSYDQLLEEARSQIYSENGKKILAKREREACARHAAGEQCGLHAFSTFQTSKGEIKIEVSATSDPMLFNSKHLCIFTTAMHAGVEIGHAIFFPNDGRRTVTCDGDPGVHVEPAWRSLGIASAMYAATEANGYEIEQSKYLTDDGERLWARLLANHAQPNASYHSLATSKR